MLNDDQQFSLDLAWNHSEFGNKVFRSLIHFSGLAKTFPWFKNVFVQKVLSPSRSGRTRKKPSRWKNIFVQIGCFCSKWVICSFQLILGHFAPFWLQMFSRSKGFLRVRRGRFWSERQKTLWIEKNLWTKKPFLNEEKVFLRVQRNKLMNEKTLFPNSLYHLLETLIRHQLGGLPDLNPLVRSA